MAELPLDLSPRSKRKRRRLPPRPRRRLRALPTQGRLFHAPDVQRCGFCGETVTVLEEAAACPRCDAIVTRSKPEDAPDTL